MKFSRLFAAAAIACVAVVGSVSAHEYKAGSLTIIHPWSRATPAANGAGFMIIENNGDQADRLVSAATPAAKTAELHTHLMDNGVMKMRAVEGGIEIPAHGKAELKPGGLHIMLMNLAKPLADGDKIPLTLTFEKAGTVEVTIKVDKPGANPLEHMEGHDHEKMDHSNMDMDHSKMDMDHSKMDMNQKQ